MAKEVPTKMIQDLDFSYILWKIMCHPCSSLENHVTSLALDGCYLAREPARLCCTLHGSYSPLKQIYGQHVNFFRSILQFEPIIQIKLAPIKLVPCEAIHFTDEESGSRISTLRSTLSEYSLISHCPTGVYCNKHHGMGSLAQEWVG